MFRYAKAGATALTIGHMNQTAVAHADFTDACSHNPAATSISTSITLAITGGSITTANCFADGHIMTKDAAGQGQMMQIKSHPVTGTASTTCKFNLYEDDYLTASVTTGTTVWGVWFNPYYDVVVCPGSAPTGMAVGVNTMAITALYYFWIQTWGACMVECDAAVVVGSGVAIDSGSAGSVLAVGSTGNTTTTLLLMHTRPMVGVAMEVAAAADHGLIFLTLAP
ncbi:MAG: hypothetical protein NWE89_06225 [Candidatus Bathyarchaeota archaeon]|nr:hypothetical protein [Candidatus Bathyarchaeota archaeon]